MVFLISESAKVTEMYNSEINAIGAKPHVDFCGHNKIHCNGFAPHYLIWFSRSATVGSSDQYWLLEVMGAIGPFVIQ